MKRTSSFVKIATLITVVAAAMLAVAIFGTRAIAADMVPFSSFLNFSTDPKVEPPLALSFFAQLAAEKQQFEGGATSYVSSPRNLVTNPGFEAMSNNMPLGWTKGGWGENTPDFLFPVDGARGDVAVGITIKHHQSGDAKWLFAPITSPLPGLYIYTDHYAANTETFITLHIELRDGGMINRELAQLPPREELTPTFSHFSIPPDTKSFVVYHLIRSEGTLAIDDVSLHLFGTFSSVFSGGAVSLVFDDGWDSQYDHATAKLDEANFKGTFFVTTERLDNNGFDNRISRRQVKKLAKMGHEVAAHTLTHPNLSTLAPKIQKKEIAGSKDDLEGMGIAPVVSFAYPFGDYDLGTVEIIRGAKFFGARSTLAGTVTPASEKYHLPHFSVENTSTLDQMKSAVDDAMANNEWLIMTFHQIDQSNVKYSVGPETFDALIEYLAQKEVNVVPFAEGLRSVQ